MQRVANQNVVTNPKNGEKKIVDEEKTCTKWSGDGEINVMTSCMCRLPARTGETDGTQNKNRDVKTGPSMWGRRDQETENGKRKMQ